MSAQITSAVNEFVSQQFTQQSKLTVARALAHFETPEVQALLAAVVKAHMPRVKRVLANGKAAKDPNAPKRARSAYILFSIDQRVAVKTAHPDFTSSQVMKELGERWGNLTEAQKHPFTVQAEQDKVRYATEHESYVPPVQEVVHENVPKSKKQRREDAAPRAKSAYQLFSQDQRVVLKAAEPTLSFKDVNVRLGAMWKEIAPEHLAEYQARAEAGRAALGAAAAHVAAPSVVAAAEVAPVVVAVVAEVAPVVVKAKRSRKTEVAAPPPVVERVSKHHKSRAKKPLNLDDEE